MLSLSGKEIGAIEGEIGEPVLFFRTQQREPKLDIPQAVLKQLNKLLTNNKNTHFRKDFAHLFTHFRIGLARPFTHFRMGLR